MFKTRNQLNERISDLESQMEALNADVEEAGKLTADAESRVQEAADQLTEAKAAITRLEEELTEQQALLNAAAEKQAADADEIAELKKAAEITDLKVAEAAVKELAAIGHEPVEELSSEAITAGPLTREQFDAEYNSIKAGKARSKWFLANKHRLTE